MTVRVDLDPSLPPDAEPVLVSGDVKECGSVERLTSRVFIFDFDSFDCDAITVCDFTKLLYTVTIDTSKVPTKKHVSDV